MKELARQASVSLATLYAHFPSKDHVLGAVAVERQRRAAAQLDASALEGSTAGERAGEVIQHEFRTLRRHPEMAVALQRVANAPDRSTSEYIAALRGEFEAMVLEAIASTGAAVTPEQQMVMPMFLSVCGSAMNGWLSGILSLQDANAQILMAQRLIDLPPAIVREYLLGP